MDGFPSIRTFRGLLAPFSVSFLFCREFCRDLTRSYQNGRAVDAAIWGMLIVNFDVMRQAFFRDANAAYGDIIFWSRPANWKLQCLTPNTSVRYVFSFINSWQIPHRKRVVGRFKSVTLWHMTW